MRKQHSLKFLLVNSFASATHRHIDKHVDSRPQLGFLDDTTVTLSLDL